jgi:hypothetical protein
MSKNITVTYIACFALGLVGCQTVTPTSTSSWNPFATSKLQESKYAVPARMAIMWSPAVFNQAGQAATRGFGGRVYFYDAKNKPIAVEGQMVVYAYHNNKPNPDSKVPDRKYAFTPEQFTQHYAPSELGASYSIWIPWDAAGQPQAEISLVPIFTSTSGALVMGQPSRNLLPGPTTPEQKSYVTNCTVPGGELAPLPSRQLPPPPPSSAVQPASFVSAPPPSAPAPSAQPPSAPHATTPSAVPGIPQYEQSRGLSTMTINLPGTMTDRLAQAGPQGSLLHRMAELRKEALARQAGYVAPGAAPSRPIGTAPAMAPWPAAAPLPAYSGPPLPTRSQHPAPPAPGGLTLPPTAGPLPTPPFPGALPSSPQTPLESAQLAIGRESLSAAMKAAR